MRKKLSLCTLRKRETRSVWCGFQDATTHSLTFILQASFLNKVSICRRLGVKTGAERRPPPGIQAQRPAPAPHARHDRSMARSSLVSRPIFEEKFIVLADASNVQGCHLGCQWPKCIVLLNKVELKVRWRRWQSMLSSRNVSNYNAFGEDKERWRHPKVRSAL